MKFLTALLTMSACVGFVAIASPRLLGEQELELATEKTLAEEQIRELLIKQTAAWNRGDIDQFMKDYWESDALSFTSGGEVTRGYEATRQRYHARYPTAERMGRTTFSELEVTMLGGDAAFVLGTWQLERADERLGGKFTLILRRYSGEWKIVHDHTSLKP
ncbi:YybH family protein [Planctomycetaceae bacterium SH139]